QQGGLWSNAVPFGVNTAVISSVSPTSGVPGTQVTITGSGFGAEQGSGQVWLGTANGVVQSWTDSQVIAVVATGSTTGNAQILQNGVMSNAVPFTVNSLHIASVTPNSGGPGTSVTIAGTGFGWNQGNGSVWLGGTNGQVVSWNNNQVVAVVADNAVTGVVRIEQNGVLSNALTFTVPTSNAVTLIPNMLNLVVGQTQTIQALDSNSQPVTGLTWASSNPRVVSLSTDDPPILTALTAGHVTITAGTASADVTVYYGTLPIGTVIWSNPGDGSGVISIVPAVPSATGVADVFALNGDCNLQAIRSDGSVAWTANIGQLPEYSPNPGPCNEFLPDFQGGVVVKGEKYVPWIVGNPFFGDHYIYTLQKFDGMTGQAYPALSLSGWWLPLNLGAIGNSYPPAVVHPDGTIFSIDALIGLPDDFYATQNFVDVIDPLTGQLKAPAIWAGGNDGVGDLMVAGDGYAYVPYASMDIYTATVSLYLLRIDTSGNSSTIALGEWAPADVTAVSLITNADQGVLVSWELQNYGNSGRVTSNTYYIAATSGGSLIAKGTTDRLVVPVLQAQDGSFYGTDSNGNMIKFDRSGNIQWSVRGDSPQIATADAGVIGSSGITYDNNGRATGQVPMPIQSWPGYAYAIGSVNQIDYSAITEANVFWPFTDLWPVTHANDSGNNTAKALPPPDANHNHTLTVREVPGANGIFGHITVQVDNNAEVGFAPKGNGPNNSLTASQKAAILANKQVPGTVEPRAAGVATLDAVTIYLTADEANDTQQYINNRTANPGYYQLVGNSCVDFGELVLIETDFPPLMDTLPRSLPKSIRAEQIKENTVQAP
ncbi:MAG: IPT/TIG domain-containing protein, partial [Thiobacillaceae bacterium]